MLNFWKVGDLDFYVLKYLSRKKYSPEGMRCPLYTGSLESPDTNAAYDDTVTNSYTSRFSIDIELDDQFVFGIKVDMMIALRELGATRFYQPIWQNWRFCLKIMFMGQTLFQTI